MCKESGWRDQERLLGFLKAQENQKCLTLWERWVVGSGLRQGKGVRAGGTDALPSVLGPLQSNLGDFSAPRLQLGVLLHSCITLVEKPDHPSHVPVPEGRRRWVSGSQHRTCSVRSVSLSDPLSPTDDPPQPEGILAIERRLDI